MTPQNWLEFAIDWMGLPALAVLGGILVYRRWYRHFPLFVLYVIGAEVVGIVRLLFMHAPRHVYSQVYWSTDTATAAFAFLATYELFFKRLFPGFYKTRLYRILFPGMAILITVLVALTALVGGHSSALPTASRVYEFLRASILLFFVALMLLMGRHWNKQEFGIAFGFGLDVSTSLFLIGIWSHTSNRSAILGRLGVLAYDIACIIWLYCFWPAPTQTGAPSAPALPAEALHEAKKWEESLKDYISPGKG
jgi:hypothetical protein